MYVHFTTGRRLAVHLPLALLPSHSFPLYSPTTIECVLLLSNVFSYYRLCSLTKECVLLLQNVFSYSLFPSHLFPPYSPTPLIHPPLNPPPPQKKNTDINDCSLATSAAWLPWFLFFSFFLFLFFFYPDTLLRTRPNV